MSDKKFTSQDMRDLAAKIWDYRKMSSGLELTCSDVGYIDCDATQDLVDMLHYAAGVMERCEKARQKLVAMTDMNSPDWSLDGNAAALADIDKIDYILQWQS